MNKADEDDSQSTIVVALCVDDNYFMQACAVINSIKINTSRRVNVYLLGLNLNEKNKEHLSLLSGVNFSISYVEVGDQNFKNFKLRSHVTLAAYIRLEIPRLLAKVDKVLYLDADLIVTGDLALLWDTPLDGKPIAAVRNPFFNRHEALLMDQESKYFNSGVLLMDLEYFRKQDISELAYRFVHTHEENMVFHDQDALNHVINGHWIELGMEYNLQTFFLRKFHKFELAERMQIKEAIERPIIIHFSSGIKPWHSFDPHPLRVEFLKHYEGEIMKCSSIKENLWVLARFVFTKLYYLMFLKMV